MADLSDDIKDAVKNRLANPLFGAYAISFVVWNWEFFYIVLRGSSRTGGVHDVVRAAWDYIDDRSSWLAPLGIALLYALTSQALAFPFQWIAKAVDIFTANKLRKLEDDRRRLSSHELRAHPEFVDLEKRRAELEQLCQRAWLELGNLRGSHAPLVLRPTVHVVDPEDLPALLAEARSGGKLVRVSEGISTIIPVLCAFAVYGEKAVACVGDNGLLPIAWQPSWFRIEFVQGRLSPVVTDREARGPWIERVSEAWGRFHEKAP